MQAPHWQPWPPLQLLQSPFGLGVVRLAQAGPQGLVDGDAGHLHGLHRLVRAPTGVERIGLVGRLVIDEPTPGDPPAQLAVGAGVQDERVPADVHEGRRAVVPARILGGQLEVGELHARRRRAEGTVVVRH